LNTKVLKTTLPALAFFVGSITALAPAAVSAQSVESKLDASLRFGLEFENQDETRFGLNNYGSRIRWGGSADISSTLDAIGYVELAVDDEGGLDTSRHLWVGVEGDIGKITAGTQYSALYDLVTSRIDIANWGSCLEELGCGRGPNQIKYSNQFGDALDDNFVEGLEGGASFTTGPLSFGAGVAFLSKRGAGTKSGFGFTGGGTFDAGNGLELSAIFQFANKNINSRLVPGSNKARTNVSFAGKFGNAYGVVGIANADNTPYYLTGGYTFNLSPKSYIYTEVTVQEPDTIEDTSLAARGVFVYTFDGIRVTAN